MTSLPFRTLIFDPGITAPEESEIRPRTRGGAFCPRSVIGLSKKTRLMSNRDVRIDDLPGASVTDETCCRVLFSAILGGRMSRTRGEVNIYLIQLRRNIDSCLLFLVLGFAITVTYLRLGRTLSALKLPS